MKRFADGLALGFRLLEAREGGEEFLLGVHHMQVLRP